MGRDEYTSSIIETPKVNNNVVLNSKYLLFCDTSSFWLPFSKLEFDAFSLVGNVKDKCFQLIINLEVK